MTREDKVGQIRDKHSRRLPLELAELLSPSLEHALNHPLRRDILRALHRANQPRTASQLVSESLPKASVTLVNYHAAVLETSNLVRRTDGGVAGEGAAHTYASNVIEDVQVLAVLGATEPLDRADC